MINPTRRRAEIMDVPLHWDDTHFRAETARYRRFVYCPTGNIVSWNPGDYEHRYCPFCKQYFGGSE